MSTFDREESILIFYKKDDELLAASFSTLTFDLQKNVLRCETIGQLRIGDPEMCPVRLIAHHIFHLRLHNSLPNTRLATSYDAIESTFNLKPSNITTSLKQAVTFLGSTLYYLLLTHQLNPCVLPAPILYYVAEWARMLSGS